jgi:hypothetical protein
LEVVDVSKKAVTWWFLGAILAVVAGVFVGVGAIVAALASGAVEFGGPDVVLVDDAFASTLLWLVFASVLFIAGGIAALVAWIGALLNTVQLEDKTWFVVLLVLGLFSFGWLATAAYVIAGPDGSERAEAYPGGATAQTG